MFVTENQSAESEFREAFERLKRGKPRFLDKKTRVTQNNVAREAGRDPSALRKSRYPLLILEIQAYVTSQNDQNELVKKSKDKRSLTNKEKLTNYRKQLNRLASIVNSQNTLIEMLFEEIHKTNPNFSINS